MSRMPTARCKSCGNYLHTGYSGVGPPPEKPPTFEQGILWAAARMCDLFDEPTMAEEIIQQAGVDIRQADEFDRDALRAKGIGRRIPGQSEESQ